MRGTAVEDEVDLAAHVVQKGGEEADEARRVERAPLAAEPQLSAGLTSNATAKHPLPFFAEAQSRDVGRDSLS